VFDALYNAKVPSAWLKTYPSLKSLGAWTRDLLARIEQLARWVEGSYPRLYWLGGFTYPTGFLTAVLQVGASPLRHSVANMIYRHPQHMGMPDGLQHLTQPCTALVSPGHHSGDGRPSIAPAWFA
jgi:hypothetical protein